MKSPAGPLPLKEVSRPHFIRQDPLSKSLPGRLHNSLERVLRTYLELALRKSLARVLMPLPSPKS